jgi:choice-of-anchor C domain-containing protein
MRKRSLFSAALAAVASLSMAGSAFAFSGITNGSFESGSFTGAPYDEFAAGSTALTGWTIDSGSLESIGSYWPASDGTRSIDLNGCCQPATISQELGTTVGASYVVTFDLSGNPSGGPAVKTLTVGATGGSTEAMSFDVVAAGATLADMKWSTREYSFDATSSTTVLTFSSTTPAGAGPALDNVRITETLPPPPPPTLVAETKLDCMDGGWVSVTDADGHPFKNQGDCVSFVATGGRNVAAAVTSSKLASAPKRPDRAGTARRSRGTEDGQRCGRSNSRGRQSQDPSLNLESRHEPSTRSEFRQVRREVARPPATRSV